MAKKTIIDQIIKLYSKLGGNLSDVLGTRTNISFLGKGKTPEPFLDMDVNPGALNALEQGKAVDELKSSIGFAVGNKLNDIQAGKLLQNLRQMDDFYNAPPNITDLATGTRDIDPKGLAALRGEVDVPIPTGGEGVMSRLEKLKQLLKTPGVTTANKIPRPETALQREMFKNFGNQAGTPLKRTSAREFLIDALKGDEIGETQLRDVIDDVDVKYITEGGGGAKGDPLALVLKYFGPRIAEKIPEGGTAEEMARFTKRVFNNVVDAKGNRPGSLDFDKNTVTFIEPFATGGLAKILEI